MEQIIDFFANLFKAENWPARWVCGIWTPFHGWLYIFSNLAIWAAYFAIPLILFYFVQKRKGDIPFIRIFWLFILFILACGTTHLMDATLFYYPAYRLSATILLICAVVSWAAILGLIKVMPDALNLKSPVQLEKIVNTRTAELKELSNDLRKQNEQLTNFADITTHNLRSPATNLVSLVELYESEKNTDKKQLYFEKFKESSHNLIHTLDDLYEILKIRKNTDIKKDDLKFESILEETMQDLSAEISKTNAQISYDFSACSAVQYPKAYLHSIFLNLLSNAIKYRSPERTPEINFRTYLSNGNVVLECKDNGLGLDLNKYGDKIFKLHKTFHRNKDARGMGLYIIKTQIETLNGSIYVKSEVNKGSIFTISF